MGIFSRGGLGILFGCATLLSAKGAAADTAATVTLRPQVVNLTIGVPQGPPPPPPPYAPPPPPPPPGPPPPPPPPPPEPIMRWGGGLRVSYGIPGGNLYRGESLGDIASGLLHLEGTGDLIILRRIVVGGHVGFGLGAPGEGFSSACNATGTSCDVWDFDIGVHGEYRFLPPPSQVNPWVGLGVSYEVLTLSEDDGVNQTSGSFGGVDVDLTAGCDFQLGSVGVGPFITYRFGSYTSTSLTVNGADEGSSVIGSTASHDWLMLGLRGRY